MLTIILSSIFIATFMVISVILIVKKKVSEGIFVFLTAFTIQSALHLAVYINMFWLFLLVITFFFILFITSEVTGDLNLGTFFFAMLCLLFLMLASHLVVFLYSPIHEIDCTFEVTISEDKSFTIKGLALESNSKEMSEAINEEVKEMLKWKIESKVFNAKLKIYCICPLNDYDKFCTCEGNHICDFCIEHIDYSRTEVEIITD